MVPEVKMVVPRYSEKVEGGMRFQGWGSVDVGLREGKERMVHFLKFIDAPVALE